MSARRSAAPAKATTAGDDGVRLGVRKTYKLYLGGQFPRSESGRTFPVLDRRGRLVAHAVLGSRKDVRDAVKAARGAHPGWAGKTAYNRGQILYRVAEVMEGRFDQFVAEVGVASADARTEVAAAIDRWVWYAGWADKLAHLAGTVNPVAGPYFTFTVPEPTGVVGIVCPDDAPLGALVARLAPAIISGNAAVVVASERGPLAAVTLAEAIATSDVPGGVVNVLTGRRAELVPVLAGHRDVDAIDLTGCADESDLLTDAERLAADSVTRVVKAKPAARAWNSPAAQSVDAVTDLMEMKSVWHPIGP
ncbi:MAG: aldehyde dehydrogenase family protein [Acidimicrobiales bacterium]